jgi:hypothetical protein
MRADGVVLVVENVMPPSYDVPVESALRDMHMLAVLGGRERTEREYADLFAQAGLRLVRSVHTQATDVIEARRS